MAINKLTDSKLKSLLGKERSKPTTISDGLGLSARVSAVGGISWLFRFSDDNKKAVWVTIGRYPDTSLKKAREERDKFRAWIDEGKDPRKEREIVRKDLFTPKTVMDAFNSWLDGYAKQNRSDLKQLTQRVHLWIPDSLARMPLSEADSDAWISAFTNRSIDSPVAAGSFLQTLKQVMTWCNKRGMQPHHTVFNLDLDLVGGKRQKKRSRKLVDEEDWSELVDLIGFLNSRALSPYYNNLVVLLLFFAARTQEIRLSKISEWNLNTMVWTVPPEHNKNFKKSESKGEKGDIKRPIPDVLRPFIAQLCLQSDSEYLLGELKTASAVSTWGRLFYQKVGHDDPWTLHDLRRTVSTSMGDLEVDPYVIEAILGHTLGGTKGIYNRSQFMRKKKRAIDEWASKLISLGLDVNPYQYVMGGN